MPTGWGDQPGGPTGDRPVTQLAPGMLVHDVETDEWGVVRHIGPLNGRGSPTWVWANWQADEKRAKDNAVAGVPTAHTSARPVYTVTAIATHNPASSKGAKRVVERFTWKPANRVQRKSMPFLTQKVNSMTSFKTLLYSSDKKLDNPLGMVKLYYHPWEDGHLRTVAITQDGKWIVAYGRCVVLPEGVDDFPKGKRYDPVAWVDVRDVTTWARLATLVGVDLPCAKRDGGTLRYSEKKRRWVCSKCGGSRSLYDLRKGSVLYDPKSKIILCYARIDGPARKNPHECAKCGAVIGPDEDWVMDTTRSTAGGQKYYHRDCKPQR